MHATLPLLTMDNTFISKYITCTYADVLPVAAWGETSFFYNPNRELPRGVYFATLKGNDGKNDRASKLERPAVFRLNIGISKPTYRALFGEQPSRPAAGGVIDTGHDFTVLDCLLPHPVYGWMSWVCVLNPTFATFQNIQPLLTEAHDLAISKFDKRLKGLSRNTSLKPRPLRSEPGSGERQTLVSNIHSPREETHD